MEDPVLDDPDYDDYLAEKQMAAIEDREYWHNRPRGTWAPCDFDYDPQKTRERE